MLHYVFKLTVVSVVVFSCALLVVEHQRLNGAIEELRAAVKREDAKIAQLATVLRGAESVLQDAVDAAAPRLAALEVANKRAVDVDEVISYGGKISASLNAPPGWNHTRPLGNSLPPAPPDEMMRAGRLAALEMETAASDAAAPAD
jgi:Vitamin-D-receptor interacting Mediator subunit 4